MSDSEALFAGLFSVTRTYLSDTSVQSAVSTALEKRGLPPDQLERANLPQVVADAMVGLRLFCEPEKFGDLMMDLTEYCESLGETLGTKSPD